jgi:hypothetical protein
MMIIASVSAATAIESSPRVVFLGFVSGVFVSGVFVVGLFVSGVFVVGLFVSGVFVVGLFVSGLFVSGVSSFLLTAMTPAIQRPRYRIVDMETLDPRKSAPSRTVKMGYE